MVLLWFILEYLLRFCLFNCTCKSDIVSRHWPKLGSLLSFSPHFHVTIFIILTFMACKLFFQLQCLGIQKHLCWNLPFLKTLANLDITSERPRKYVPLEICHHVCYFGMALWKDGRSRYQLHNSNVSSFIISVSQIIDSCFEVVRILWSNFKT